MEKNMTINNQTAAALSDILGGATFKSVGSDLFLPMLELISTLSETVSKADKLREAVYKQYNLESDARGYVVFPDMEVAGEVKKLVDEINDKPVEVADLPLLSKEQLQKLSDENPSIKGAALLLLLKNLVKPE